MSAKKGKQRKGRRSSSGPQTRFDPLGQVSAWFRDRHPILRFLLGFIGCMLLFYLFYYSSLYRDRLELPFLNGQAKLSNVLLNVLGFDTAVDGTIIRGQDFFVNIRNGCDGLEAIAILISGILIFPVAFRYKAPGLLWGVIVLLVANLLRIAGLYLAGRYFSKEVFDVLHIQGGFIIFTLLSVLLWFIWMNWATQKIRESSEV